MKKVYLDCNILLDFILERKPFVKNASLLIDLIAKKQCIGVVSPLTIANVYYIVRKEQNKAFALEFAKHCQQIFQFCDNSSNALHQAIDNNYKDFEDDIHFYSVIDSGINIIVTRNPKDFPVSDKSNIQIFTPDEMLRELGY